MMLPIGVAALGRMFAVKNESSKVTAKDYFDI